MSKILFTFIILAGYLLFMTSFSGCRKKEKTDPCAGEEATSAKFQITYPLQACNCPLDPGSPNEKYFPADTVFVGYTFLPMFSALYNMSNYTWKVGADTETWHTKSFAIWFS